MKYSIIATSVVAIVLAGAGSLRAETTCTWDVATVHGYNQFTIGSSNGTPSLLYDYQGWTDYVWYENNGSPPGTIATTDNGENAPDLEPRSGMKTYATTDVAYGKKLCEIKLEYEYNNTLGLYPSMNFFMQDSSDHYGIFSPASGGIAAVSTQDILNGWTRMTLDLTRSDILDTAKVAVYEHNGLCDEYGVPFTSMTWGDIKDFTIAGWYDYQRSPTGGWDAWSASFDEQHGLGLIWGDTVNSGGNYGSAQREIRDVTVTFGGTIYDGTFENAQVPEPGAVVGLIGLMLMGLVMRVRYLHRNK